jgi:hypothetical protein
MEAVTSKRHLTNFYLLISFLILYFIGGGFYFISQFNKIKGDKYSGEVFIFIFGLLVMALGLYILRIMIKLSPKIHITAEIISFNNVQFSINTIKEINFTGDIKVSGFIYDLDASVITFTDGTKKHIVDSMFSNSREMKLYLRSLLYNNDAAKKEISTDKEEHILKGKSYLTSDQLIIIGMAVFYAYMLLSDFGNQKIYPLILICLLFFGGFSFNLFYLEISENKLVIRNHNFWWFTEVYQINNIDEITIHYYPRRGSAIKILQHDFQKATFVCSSLNKRNWKKLEEILRSQNIKVNNYLQ